MISNPCFSLGKRFFLSSMIVVASLLANVSHAQEAFPTKALTLVVPFAPGGGTDILARIVATGMSSELGQPVVVENKPGAFTTIAVAKVLHTKSDGYTMLLGNTNTFVVNELLQKNLSYDARKDLFVIGSVARFPMILVVPTSSPVESLTQFVEYAKNKSDPIQYGSPGVGSPHHLSMEMIKDQAKIDGTHIAYRGVSPAFPDLISGRLDAMFVDYAAGSSLINDGRLRPLAVASKAPSPLVPGVQPMADQGYPEFDITGWQAIAVTSDTPQAARDILAKALEATMNSEDIRQKLMNAGLEPFHLGPHEFGDYLETERQRLGHLVNTNNITID